MAVVLTTDPSGILRTTGLVPASGDQSFHFLYRITGAPTSGQFDTIFRLGDDPTGANANFIRLRRKSNGQLEWHIGSLASNTGINITGGVGYRHVGYIRTGTTHRLYWDGALAATLTADVSSWTHTHFYLGTDTVANDTQSSQIQYFREWSSAITQDELVADAGTPGIVAGATCDTPLVSDLLDVSGNSHDWAMYNQAASFTAAPFNVTWLQATAVGLSFSQSAHIDGVTYALWFKHGPLRSGMFSVFGAASDQIAPAGYNPTIATFTIISYVPTTYAGNVAAAPGPTQQYFELGTTYYIKVTSSSGNPTPANLLLTIVASPTTAFAAGDLLTFEGHDMTSNGQYWGAPILNPSTGDVKQIRNPVLGGSFGDAMPITGELCLSDQFAGTVRFYDSCFVLLASVGATRAVVRTSAAQRRFYVWYGSGSTTRTLKAFSPVGELLQTWTITVTGKSFGTAPAMAVSNDGTVLYVGLGSGGIYRYDLVSEAWLNKLADSLSAPGLWFGDYNVGLTMLVMADDTILVTEEDAQESSTAGAQNFWKVVLQYEDTGAGSPTGSLLNRWDFPGRAAIADRFACRISYSLNDPGSFWFTQDDPTQPRTYVTVGEYSTTVSGVSLVAPAPLRTWTAQSFQFGILEYQGADGINPSFLSANSAPLDSPRSGPPLAPNVIVIRRGCGGNIGPLAWVHMKRKRLG